VAISAWVMPKAEALSTRERWASVGTYSAVNFTFPITQPRDARALFAKWSVLMGRRRISSYVGRCSIVWKANLFHRMPDKISFRRVSSFLRLYPSNMLPRVVLPKAEAQKLARESRGKRKCESLKLFQILLTDAITY
jgi:hypothetical protein